MELDIKGIKFRYIISVNKNKWQLGIRILRF
jgi:hypothetical protein